MIERVRRLGAVLDAWSVRHRLTRVSRRAVSGFLAHEALQFAGSMAYFGVLSIFQVLLLGVVVASYLMGEGEARAFVIEQVASGSPLEPEVVGGVIDAIVESRGGMTIISFAFLTWGALGAFSALSTGIGRVFENAPPRPFLRDKLLGLLLMGLTGLLALASLVIGIATGAIQAVARDQLGGVAGGGSALWVIGLVVPILLIFVAFWVIYRVVPNRPLSWREVLPGAVVAALLWTVLRFGFTYYATNVANYDSAFGPLSTGVTLMVFMYFAGVVVLLGAEFARASALDDVLGPITAADPRLLPVPVAMTPGPVPRPRRGISRWAVLAGGALIGLVAGRLSRRDDD